jgi:hypothetical protein
MDEKRCTFVRIGTGTTNQFDGSSRGGFLTVRRDDLNVKVLAQCPFPEPVEKYSRASVRNLE